MYVSLNRENLRFSVKKVKKEQQLEELHWLIELIKQHAKDPPKTLIFCNTLNEIAQVTNYLLSKLGAHVYYQQNKVPQNCFLGLYHSNSLDTLHEKMDLQQLQNQCKYEVNTTFDQICLYLPRGKFHRWIIFARKAKMVNTAFTQSLQSKANEKKNCTFASDLT